MLHHPARSAWLKLQYLLVILALVVSAIALNASPARAAPETNFALQFNGANQYVTFGPATSTLGVTNFTIEAWVKRSSGGTAIGTGTGGLGAGAYPAAYPVVTKGRGEGESPANLNTNYFVGIATTGVIAADFEDTINGTNHPITGTTAIPLNEWHHIAVTYDGQTWRLYLDGALDKAVALASPFAPEATSTQHAGIATAMTSTGAPSGYFAGAVDEVRIWNFVRTQAEIQAGMNSEVLSGTGLLGRWGLNDGTGTAAQNSVGGSPNGTLTNGPLWGCGKFAVNCGLQFNGTNQYATFGNAPGLTAQRFSLETWFNWNGGGMTTSTGTGGLTAVIPLVSKGRGESEAATYNVNYFLGISSGKLAADFEEYAGANTGLNHPITGTTTVSPNAWHHAAVTYDGSCWQLYLDGSPESMTGTVCPGVNPDYNSIQHAGIGSALNSTGAADGFFNGAIDEARIWNYARTQNEIQTAINQEITSATGLLGRWGMNENQGTVLNDSTTPAESGAMTGSPMWVTGAPFSVSFTPAAPSGLTVTPISFGQIQLAWADNSNNETGFEIERSTTGSGGAFTPLTTANANSPGYDNLNLSPATEYCYRARAVNGTWPSSYAGPICATTLTEQAAALQFDGVNDYVTFGPAPELGLQSFTIETWFKRTGAGVAVSTGTNGVVAVPLVTKGSPQADGSNVDENYILGIRSSDNVLVADFETYAACNSRPAGDNTPLVGITPIVNDTWYHAAFTYDGTALKLYLNGVLENALATTCLPRYDSIQHAGLGTYLTSSGASSGYFNGVLDEVRIWNTARPQSDIIADMFHEITSGTGLVARWSLNEGTGGFANNTINSGAYGALTSGPVWVGGTPFALTARFQDGVNGYSGTADTYLLESSAATSFSAQPDLGWDLEDINGDPSTRKYGLVRFDNIFGSGAGQIPLGASIVSAVLTYTVHNDSADLFNLNEVAIDWPESVTYNSFGSTAGVQAADYGALIATATAPLGQNSLNVMSSIAAWANAPASNRGWIFIPTSSFGADVRSSDYTAVPGERPALSVMYTFTPPTTPPAAPTDLAATPTIGTQIDLHWTDNASDESVFQIDRATNGSGGPFTLLATVGTNVTTYMDSDLAANTEYCYRVRAANAYGPSAYTSIVCATTTANPNNAIDFGGTNAYVTFGDPAALDLAQFTIETWFRRDGTGVTANTGTSGVLAVPLVTKGRGEAEGSNVDMNYFLGIRAADNVLVADFEEGVGGPGPLGQNRPVAGATPIQNGVWYHAAAVYDGQTWTLYLNGNLEATLTFTTPIPPRADSIQRAALASALNSTGAPEGYFDGAIDEARVWNFAQTQAQVRSTINTQLAAPQTGLVARWGLNEGSGVVVGDTSGNLITGTLTSGNYRWAPGAPFNINFAPDAPTLVAPGNGSTVATLSPALGVNVSDSDSSDLVVTFYGRPQINSGAPFTLTVLPDSQNYTAGLSGGSNATFVAQTQWIVDNQAAQNVPYVVHLGDITNDGDSAPLQWTNARDALYVLETAPASVPYGAALGNHDQINGTAQYNTYFGISHFAGRSYYGGHYGTNNNNHYDLFSAGGMDFIVIYVENGGPSDSSIVNWANGLLQTYSNRRAIVILHDLLTTSNVFSAQGTTLYNALRGNANLFLMMGGHLDTEGRRTDTYNGNTVYSLRSDYQTRPNGGNGWLRLLNFVPASNQINVRTYSPTLGQWETDADSRFTLSYDMQGPAFQLIGAVTVTNGSTADIVWPNRQANTQYEWYAVVHDGNNGTIGPTWNFTTPVAYTLTVNTAGNGSVDKSPNQVTYLYDDVVTLTATAAAGWTFSGWTGDLSGSANPATITIDANKIVTATFAPLSYTLSVNTVGNGSVDKSPNQATYLYGDVVTLTATAATGWAFGGWTGDLSGSASPAAITIDANKAVTATFSSACVPVTGIDFLFAPTAPRVSQPVTFSASVTAGTTPITYTWNFGDGGDMITTTAVIQHIYPLTTTLRTYTTMLTAANACDSQATQKPIVVRPYGIYLPVAMRNP